ncbi:UvrD-helicase domain-containing protein [Pseudomonas sp. NPDC087639]|uniref:UvrD-helicase domain-containing protein n=1 Tax=Pseudomonas sp. NPDC087639 TaxID=3364445 RepID=UPI0037F43ACC
MPKQSPAERASQLALEKMYDCIEAGKSFLLEAGAGAGKTYSLIEALKYLLKRDQATLMREHQQIACITFTNVAKDQIAARTDRSPAIYCETNHAFCWSLISGFQKNLRELVAQLPKWQELLAESGCGIGNRSIEYNLGHRSLRDSRALLHHDDVLPLTIAMMSHAKFRSIVRDRFPIILVDEYQDTDKDWIEAIKTLFLGQPDSPLFGFFGDHWQKIYDGGCGRLTHPSVTEIGKGANFRSVKPVVDCLNRMRPGLNQCVTDPDAPGQVRVFLTNKWTGPRQTGAHWAGDLPTEVGKMALNNVKQQLEVDGWNLQNTKILMLTHRLLAAEQGYTNLAANFMFNEAFTKKEHPHIAYFVDALEPACKAFANQRYGLMFEALGGRTPLLSRHQDKAAWDTAMNQLAKLQNENTVGEVIKHLQSTRRPRLPDTIEKLENELETFDSAGNELSRRLAELQGLHGIPYSEVQALSRYLDGHSPFETKHGVKGAQFENVLVVVGRGWSKYNFGEMLENASLQSVPANRREKFERNRNLFYVACSRPKTRLALLFTQEMSAPASSTLQSWFGPDSISEVQF